jgi:Rrf2 family transcriptional regulator, iron-sulfur cluster assembly transcription factor
MRLRLTRGGDYAVRAMLALAAHACAEPLSSRLIAREWAIPSQFMPQVMRRLTEHGLVVPVVGRHGGYRLARPAADISLLAVIRAVEEPLGAPECSLRGGPCRPDARCLVHDSLVAAQQQFLDSLAAWSLAEILEGDGWRPPSSIVECRDGPMAPGSVPGQTTTGRPPSQTPSIRPGSASRS